jgi:hypothetical protein
MRLRGVALRMARLFLILFQPMPLMNRPLPVDDPNRIFELKYNGFRALAVVERVRRSLSPAAAIYSRLMCDKKRTF